mmetsp:Transcript_83411/g.232635  ORF Transcript_83411/g.232635 Transcript_83411/m.232635 type:complete len:210 (-) Transcript_83411:32-661(-)
MLWMREFPREQRKDDLHGEGSAVHEVTVEHIRVLLRRHAIPLPNMKQVVILPMDVTTYSQLAIVGDVHVHQRFRRLQQLDRVDHYGVCVLFCKLPLFLLPLHQMLAECSATLPALVNWPAVRSFDGHTMEIPRLAQRGSPVARNRFHELFLLKHLHAMFAFLRRFSILRRQSTQLGKVGQRVFDTTQCQICSSSSVPSLLEIGIGLDGL